MNQDSPRTITREDLSTRPLVSRILFASADGGWLVPEAERPPDWRDREQPQPYVEPPKRRAQSASRPALHRPAPARPVVEPKPSALPERNEAVTPAAIVAGWRRGRTPGEIAAELGCCRSLVYQRLMAARKEDPEFRAIEAALRLCSCGSPKYAHRPQCARCTAGKQMGEVTARPDITVALVVERLRALRRLREIAVELRCERKLLQRRVKAALADPEFGPELEALRTCTSCRGRKQMFTPRALCRRCAMGEKVGRAA